MSEINENIESPETPQAGEPALPEGVRLPPKRKDADAPKADKPAKAGKAAKAPKPEPKEDPAHLERMQAAEQIAGQIAQLAQSGDKKVMAYLVAQAIEGRATAKHVRETSGAQ